MIKSLYRRNLNSTKLIIEEEQQYREDFQMRMLKENKIQGLLYFHGLGIKGYSQYHYDITGKIPVRAMYEKAGITQGELSGFLRQLSDVLTEIKRYLLDADCLLLEPEYIFHSKGQFYFCYLPIPHDSMCEEFHHLTEFIVSRADYKDRDAVFMAYQIHKASMEENYSLEQVLESAYAVKEEESVQGEVTEDQELCYEEEPDQDFSLPEKRKKLRIIQSLKSKRKKKKWGDWKDLIPEEDGL